MQKSGYRMVKPVWRALWFRRVMFFLCAATVGYAIFRATPPPQLFHQSDKVGHALAFFALSLTAYWAFEGVRWFYFWPLMLALAPLLEYLQDVLRPLRVYSVEDSYANLLGVTIALLLVSCVRMYRGYKNN